MPSTELRSLAAIRDRQELIRKAAEREARQQSVLPEPSPEEPSIVQLPGTLYVRYNNALKQFLGFGFTPTDDSWPGGIQLAGPEVGGNWHEWDHPLWVGLREYLQNVQGISGETAFTVEWTEDGWRTSTL